MDHYSVPWGSSSFRKTKYIGKIDEASILEDAKDFIEDEIASELVIHTDDSYGIGLTELFIEELSAYHKEPAAVVEMPLDSADTFDYAGAVSLMKEICPDAVFAITPNSASVLSCVFIIEDKAYKSD